MLCQNCGKNEVNFRYTQIINGVKKEMALCDKCAKELGLESLDFNMPINFSSFLGDFLSVASENSFLPSFVKTNTLKLSLVATLIRTLKMRFFCTLSDITTTVVYLVKAHQ